MVTHDNYYMGDKFYYRLDLLDGLQSRFFIYDLAEDQNEQLEFIHEHSINSFSFTECSLSSPKDADPKQTYKELLTVMDQLPADTISLNLTCFEEYDNLDFLKRFSDCRQLVLHCTLKNRFDFRILDNLSQATLWYVKNLESILQCPNLNSLCIFKPNSKAITLISNLERLQTLSIRQSQINSIEPLAQLHGLESLELRYLPKLTAIAPLTTLEDLQDLHFQNCIHVEDWNTLDHLPNLESLVIENCGKVEISAALAVRLSYLHFVGNSQPSTQ